MTVLCLNYFRTWKFQANKLPTVSEQWECNKQVPLSHSTTEFPLVHAFCGINGPGKL